MILSLSPRLSGLLSLTMAAMALSGCALLSSPDPVQMYRFGGDATAVNPAQASSPVQVQLRRIEFPQASQGDRILGVTAGTEAAYVGGARWVSPAEQLYGDSLTHAFAARSSTVRLIGRRELTPSTRVLDVDVLAFEARYDFAGSVPTIVVSARARLLRFPERTVAAERTFTVNRPASENRVTSIVQAFDAATDDLNGQIVSWTDAGVAAR